MTLNERIYQDLIELLNKGKIASAVPLENEFGISSRTIPQYFTGNRDAETVIVMLNPAGDTQKAENETMAKLVLYRQLGITAFVNNVIGDNTNAGYVFADIMSDFDLKTAAFLSAWQDSGINIPEGFYDPSKNAITENLVIRKIANHNCLQQKLQLELLPFSSKNFEGVKMNDSHINLLRPYVETILDEIFRVERKYVIFAGDPFLNIFSSNDYKNNVAFVNSKQHIKLKKDDGHLMHNNVNCTPITIKYHNKQIKAIIANSFASQSISKALGIVRRYGEFCHSTYIHF